MPLVPRRPDETIVKGPMRSRPEADFECARYARLLVKKGLAKEYGVRVVPATPTSSMWSVAVGKHPRL